MSNQLPGRSLLPARRASRRSLLAGAGVTAAGASVAALTRAAHAQDATPTPDSDAADAGAGLNSATLGTALARLDRLAAEKIAEGAVPGMAIAVVFGNEVIFRKGYGVRDVDTGEPVTPDTVFQIASLSKAVSSSVMAAVIGDGDASWDDTMASRYPDFQLGEAWVSDQATLRDSFCHRTGVPGLVGTDLEMVGYDLDTIMHRLRYVPVSGKFRQTYSYSNMMMTAGAEALVAPLGAEWVDVAETRVFAPLGMASTSYRYQDYLARENRSELHVRIDDAWAPAIKRDPENQSPAGGLSTSVNDLAIWARMQLANGLVDGEQFIAEDALRETHIPQIMRGPSPINGRPAFYALGWGSDVNTDGRIVLRHAGAFSQGARTDAMLLPDEQLAIITLTNAFPTGTPDAINETFYDLVFHGEPTQDWFAIYNAGFQMIFDAFAGDPNRWASPPDAVSPALPNSAYVGTYHNDYGGDAIVEEVDGGLQVRIGPDGVTVWPLTHWDRDTFTYVSFPEPPAPLVAARFDIGEDQQAISLFLENMNDIGLGTFTRVAAED